jgi:hypothetical protein
MKKFYGIVIFTCLAMTTFFSCKDDGHDHNEEELITTLIYTVKDASGNGVVFTFLDADGDGGNAPIITTEGELVKNKTYFGSVIVRNDSTNPSVDITEEIEEEDEDHQFFFSALQGVTITYDDKDANNNPVGLKTKVEVGDISGKGPLKIVLRHQPNKGGTGVSSGDITNAGGETDIEVEFEVTVK